MVERIRGFLAPVILDRRGAAAIIFAFTLIPIVGAVGLAIDSSLGYLLRSRMSKSLDTAGLAAGRVALSIDAESVAQQYFDANF
jgi:Flp pilus assembly protein TadG